MGRIQDMLDNVFDERLRAEGSNIKLFYKTLNEHFRDDGIDCHAVLSDKKIFVKDGNDKDILRIESDGTRLVDDVVFVTRAKAYTPDGKEIGQIPAMYDKCDFQKSLESVDRMMIERKREHEMRFSR